MKKLKLIIPLSILFVLNSKSCQGFVFFAFLIFCNFKSSADTHDYGCLVGNRIFQLLDPAHPGAINFLYNDNGSAFANNFSNRVGRCADDNSTSCNLYNFDGTFNSFGNLADYSIDFCPLDDYLPIFFLFCGSIGFIMVRRQLDVQT